MLLYSIPPTVSRVVGSFGNYLFLHGAPISSLTVGKEVLGHFLLAFLSSLGYLHKGEDNPFLTQGYFFFNSTY